MSNRKSSVRITNPAYAKTRLPNPRGEFSPEVEKPDPVTPKMIARHRQITPGPRVTITNPKGADLA